MFAIELSTERRMSNFLSAVFLRHKGSFNNYVDKKKGRGSAKSPRGPKPSIFIPLGTVMRGKKEIITLN